MARRTADTFRILLLVYLSLALEHDATFGNESFHELSGKHLKIASSDIRPYMFIERTPDGKISQLGGMFYEMIEWLANEFNFTYTIVDSPDGFIGSRVNGTWNGMIGLAYNREVDLVAAPVTASKERAEILDFTTPYLDDATGILIPAPVEGGNMWALVKPYQFQAWIGFYLALLCVAATSWMATKKCVARNREKPMQDRVTSSFREHLFVTFQTFCRQPTKHWLFASTSNRFSLLGLSLAVIVVSGVYTATLIAFVTVSQMNPIVANVGELATTDKLQLLVMTNSIFESRLMESTSGNLKLLGDQLRRHPENRLSSEYFNLSRIKQKVLEGKYAFIGIKAQLDTVNEMIWKETGQCLVSMLPHKLVLSVPRFALPKGSPYTRVINHGFNIMRDAGLFQRWIDTYLKKIDRCASMYSEQTADKYQISLKLFSLKGAFMIFSIMIFISSLAFALERMVFAFHRRNIIVL